MGLGTELTLLLALGFVVLGPNRMHAMLGHVERAKAELHKVSCGIKSQLQGTPEMMLRLPAERAIVRTVYEEVRSVHANSADSICGHRPHIQLSWLQL